MARDDERNKLIIPTAPPPVTRRGCPRCGHPDFGGRRISGTVTFTCKKCGNKWQGGLPQELIDPRETVPPLNPLSAPPISFSKNKNGEVVETRRLVSAIPEFRKGAPLPPPGEEDV